MTQILRKVLLVVLGFVWLLPLYLMLANAAKTDAEYGSTSVWQPAGVNGFVDNLLNAWDLGRISEGVASTALYSILSPLVAVVIGAMAGFAIVALRLKFGFVWFVAIFCSTVFPIQMVLMPLFVGYVQVGLFDTRTGMILIYMVISVPFSAFVMRNFFSGIARSVFEAAVVDGASTWRIFWRIYLPMSSSALLAVFILQSTFIWNDLLLGLSLSQSTDVRPVMTALSAMQSTYGGSTMPTVLAAGLLVSIPTLVLFLAAQRTFTRGLSLGQF